MGRFTFLKAFNSPFKRPTLKLYVGKIAIGTPYFFPRRTVKDPDKPGWLKFVPKKIGFDFVGLGYKTKWTDTDYRFEWGPLWSFVFFKWQIAVSFNVPDPHHYWVCWLTYMNDTNEDLPTEERIKIAREINPEIWISNRGQGKKEKICYWDKVLKERYL